MCFSTSDAAHPIVLFTHDCVLLKLILMSLNVSTKYIWQILSQILSHEYQTKQAREHIETHWTLIIYSVKEKVHMHTIELLALSDTAVVFEMHRKNDIEWGLLLNQGQEVLQ